MPHVIYECGISGRVAGVDEVGRGSLAGPVLAAAVVFSSAYVPNNLLKVVNDSKKLSSSRRELLLLSIKKYADVGIGTSSVTEIDSLNILQATLLAMTRAIESLKNVDHALIDGCIIPQVYCTTTAIVNGDQVSATIAAASIVAKVTRDHLMIRLARGCQGYGWEKNMGYGTQEHKDSITRLGLTIYHRKSFIPVDTL